MSVPNPHRDYAVQLGRFCSRDNERGRGANRRWIAAAAEIDWNGTVPVFQVTTDCLDCEVCGLQRRIRVVRPPAGYFGLGGPPIEFTVIARPSGALGSVDVWQRT
jgi:hypothetical protein